MRLKKLLREEIDQRKLRRAPWRYKLTYVDYHGCNISFTQEYNTKEEAQAAMAVKKNEIVAFMPGRMFEYYGSI